MNSTIDPALPGLNSPCVFDSEMADSIEGTELNFFNSAFPQDSPGRFFGDDALNSSPYQSSLAMNTRKNQMPTNFARSEPALSASPDSSLQDSSSDSSSQQKSRSSKSSPSAPARNDGGTNDLTQTQEWKGDGNIAPDSGNVFDLSGTGGSGYNIFDISNRAMENDFDFDSAASSPSPMANPNAPTFAGARHIAIPYRASPRASASLVPHRRSGGTRETSPLSPLVPPEYRPPTLLQHGHTLSASSSEEYIDGTMLQQGVENLSYRQQSFNGGFPGGIALPNSPVAFSNSPMDFFAGPTIPPAPGGSLNTAPLRPLLTIHPTPHKSRVETQIPVKMTLFPVPQGITKLHLPSHTIAKPKLLAKPSPPKSPDTLELHTTLVCTSAMQDSAKLQRALARAAQTPPGVKREEARRSSSGDATVPVDEETLPLNGGEVNICVGCITRERKRAGRKKSKKPEEDEPWQKEEAKRIIVFNNPEVKEWQSLSNGSDDSDGITRLQQSISPQMIDTAREISLQMRIACYCRHQNEKLGFQVIFTIKDCEDNLIAQAMTNPIVITDDHKTHAPPSSVPPPESAFSDHAPLPGGVFGREPLENYGPAPFRNSHSTTDLQRLQQNFNPPFTSRPFATPQNPSQATSVSITPRNLSRQASPSNLPGPAYKKRKASGSGKIPDGLTMTRIQTTSGPSSIQATAWPTNGTSNPVSPVGASPFASSFPPLSNSHERQQVSTPPSRGSQQYGGPPTPNSHDFGFMTNANRTQSLEDMASVQRMFSAPSSTLPSRAPSPNSNGQIAMPMPLTHAPTLSTAAMAMPNNMNLQRQPTIHKLIPAEGTRAGGIEVTILGSGFHRGLEVMFGDSLATTTTYWGETSLVCLLPPASRAGLVPVTLKHQYQQQQLQLAYYPSSSLPKNQILFRYCEDDEQELMRHALLVVHHKMTGTVEEPGHIARKILDENRGSGNGSWSGGSMQGGNHHQMIALQSRLASTVDLETSVLKCLEFIDLDDSPFGARLNSKRINGQTMLHLGASLGYQRLVAGLLARGANPDLRDKNGMSAMHMAALHGHSKIIRKLRIAGADPNLRSLRGFTPADMADSDDVVDAVQRLLDHSRSRSAGASTTSLHSRCSSTNSIGSLWETTSALASVKLDDSSDNGSGDDEPLYTISDIGARRASASARHRARSRRNSTTMDQRSVLQVPKQVIEQSGLLSPAAAMAVWRDQLASQIQHFQHSVNWTLPNLQIPTLPPMPTLPDYQAHPMVRRFSSLVPQRTPRPDTPLRGISESKEKESDYCWWELLTGTAASPPAYDEIFPTGNVQNIDLKTASAASAATDAVTDQKCAAMFDRPLTEASAQVAISATSPAGLEKDLWELQRDQLISAHARKVKRLRSDRNLFFIWIPLLLFVVGMMLKDRVPQVWQGLQKSATFIEHRYQQWCV